MSLRLQFVSVFVFLTVAIGCGSNKSPDPEKSIKVPLHSVRSAYQ